MTYIYLWIIVCGLACFAAGLFVGATNAKNKRFGDLRIDQSDPDGPYVFLELNHELGELMQKKSVVLNVRVEDYVTRK